MKPIILSYAKGRPAASMGVSCLQRDYIHDEANGDFHTRTLFRTYVQGLYSKNLYKLKALFIRPTDDAANADNERREFLLTLKL